MAVPPEGAASPKPARCNYCGAEFDIRQAVEARDVEEAASAVSVSWSFRTSMGVLRIKPSSSRAGRFELWLDEVYINSFASPEIAADDVYMAMTGGPPGLDEALESEAPSELAQWTRHERER